MVARLFFAVLAGASVGFVAGPSMAAGKYDSAVGNAVAATTMAEKCRGVATIGGGQYQAFVLAAADEVKKDGLRKNKFKKLMFYGQSSYLRQMEADTLSGRGVDAANSSQLCTLAKKVAGKNDAIGRFLVKE